MVSYWDLLPPPAPGQPFVPWLPDPDLLSYYSAFAAPAAPQAGASSKGSIASSVKQFGGESGAAMLPPPATSWDLLPPSHVGPFAPMVPVSGQDKPYPYPPPAAPAVSPSTSAPQQALDQERALERAMRPRLPTAAEAIGMAGGLPSRQSWWMNALDLVDPYLAADIRSGKLREMFTSPPRELAQNTLNAAVESNQSFIHGLSEIAHRRTASGAAQATGGILGFVGSLLTGASSTLGDEATKWTGNPDFGRKVGILGPLFSSPSAAARPSMAASSPFTSANVVRPLNLTRPGELAEGAMPGFAPSALNTAPSAAANVQQYTREQAAASRAGLQTSEQSRARPLTSEEDNSRLLYNKDRDILRQIDPGNVELQTSRPADWIPSIQDRQMLNDKISILRVQKGFFDLHNHHNFPQADEFAPMFNAVGINPDDYRNYMWARDHGALHTGPKNWNSLWREFQRENQRPTLNTVHEQLNNMLATPREP